ncbi:transglycosylase family protein [Streptomyces sp. CHD11]|nr:transglycosylase family protein [Streptomyces sp. CHD11]
MLSGNGRHRRPRQAPALLVAAGVTGSAIAIPLLGAGSASAADGLNWDRVAECESGGSWSQNSGNGFYGGLQLTQADWEKYGGLDYASSPDQASRGQQISVAEKILDDQGVGAWRTCGLLAGLGQETPAADTGAGASGSTGSSAAPGSGDASSAPSPSATSDPSSGAGSGERTPAGTVDASSGPGRTAGGLGQGASDGATADPGTSPSGSAGSAADKPDNQERTDGSSASTDTEGSGGGRHRGPSAAEDKGQDRASDASGRHASRGLNAWGGTADDSAPVPGEGGGSPAVSDSPAVGGGWGVLQASDGQLLGGGPNLVLPGQ